MEYPNRLTKQNGKIKKYFITLKFSKMKKIKLNKQTIATLDAPGKIYGGEPPTHLNGRLALASQCLAGTCEGNTCPGQACEIEDPGNPNTY